MTGIIALIAYVSVTNVRDYFMWQTSDDAEATPAAIRQAVWRVACCNGTVTAAPAVMSPSKVPRAAAERCQPPR